MALATTLKLADLRTDVLDQLRDPGGVRYSPTRILSALVRALTMLAEDGAFWREEVFVPGAGEANFRLAGLIVFPEDATWNGKSLTQADDSMLRRLMGTDWRSQVGEPRYFYLSGNNWVRLAPAPEKAGDALTFDVSSTDKTEIEWLGLPAYEMSGTDLGSSSWRLWKPGDGQVTNDDSAENLFRIRYTYLPLGLSEDTEIPYLYHEALKAFALWRELSVSRRPEDKAVSEGHRLEWLSGKAVVGNRIPPGQAILGGRNLLGECG